MNRRTLRYVLIGVSMVVTVWFAHFAYNRGWVTLLNEREVKNLLEIIITISGIASAVIFAIVVQKYSEARTSFYLLLSELMNKQRIVQQFRELCRASMDTYEVWSSLGFDYSGKTKKATKRPESRIESSYPLLLYQSICRIGDGCYQEYHKTEEGRKPLSYSTLEWLSKEINNIWYLLDDTGKSRGVKEAFSTIKEQRLVHKQKWVELIAQSVYVSPYGDHFSSFDYWRQASAEVWEVCQDIIRTHRRLQETSPKEYLSKFTTPITLILTSGLVIPLLLLALAYSFDPLYFVMMAYLDLVLFIIAFAMFAFKVRRLVTDEDLYSTEIERPT